jgi:hypothetical protein
VKGHQLLKSLGLSLDWVLSHYSNERVEGARSREGSEKGPSEDQPRRPS